MMTQEQAVQATRLDMATSYAHDAVNAVTHARKALRYAEGEDVARIAANLRSVEDELEALLQDLRAERDAADDRDCPYCHRPGSQCICP